MISYLCPTDRQPNRTEPARAREVGADSVEVHPIRSALVVVGLVSVALMIPNTRPMESCMHLSDGWLVGWLVGGGGGRGRIDFLGMGTERPYVREYAQTHTHSNRGNRKFIPNHNNFSIMSHKPNIWLHLEDRRCRGLNRVRCGVGSAGTNRITFAGDMQAYNQITHARFLFSEQGGG